MSTGVCHLCLHCELSGEFPEGGGPLTFIPTAPTQKHPELLHQCHPTAMRVNNDPQLDSQCIFSANVLSPGPAVHRTSSCPSALCSYTIFFPPNSLPNCPPNTIRHWLRL